MHHKPMQQSLNIHCFGFLHVFADVCPIGMSYLTKEECQAQRGGCPRVCLDAMASVECATECYDGCYCSTGYYLFNNSCVLLSHCPCYHQGLLYTQGASVPYDACNNWYVFS